MAVQVGTLYPLVRSPGLGDHVDTFLTAATWVDVAQLAANTANPYTLAVGANVFRVISSVFPTYGNLNGAAAIPVAGVTNGTASFIIPASGLYMLRPAGLSVLSLICASAAFVTIEAWN
jgi:hypothetical protein